jgi:hypothetical protein
VDEAFFRSLDASIGSGSPVIEVLTTDWQENRAAAATEVWTEDWEDGETDHEWEEIGWMYMDVMEYVVMYDRLVNPFEWHHYYERPYKASVDFHEIHCDGSTD